MMSGYLLSYWYYLIIVGPALVFAIVASARVKSNFNKYSKVRNSRGLTGAQAAQAVLNHYGITDVVIEHVGGNLTDHFDPKNNVIRLSDEVYSSTSISAVGVACHEAGHAAQYAQSYVPIKIRNAILPVCNFGSRFGIPIAILGMFIAQPFGEYLITLGLILYSLVALFQFITLPVEFNASSRAIKVIDETSLLYDDEIGGAKKVLKAAALTYVAALATSLANLLRLILMFSRRSDRR
ncbi:MAG: zinc metallopeptidase [Clostridia bacterium]|nr:zinc metallopeptidase [Clostridia bacterium]